LADKYALFDANFDQIWGVQRCRSSQKRAGIFKRLPKRLVPIKMPQHLGVKFQASRFVVQNLIPRNGVLMAAKKSNPNWVRLENYFDKYANW
jgi:hypothetical protein